MDGHIFSRRLFLCLFLCYVSPNCSTNEVCSNNIHPGTKGDPGEEGAEGEEGIMGKSGPSGKQGLPGEYGDKGLLGQIGKRGPRGMRGDKGQQGTDGIQGLKGKPGSVCDCGKYRKVIGQMDASISKVKNAIKFIKKVVLGIRETENMFYLLVTEARTYQQSLLNCKLRGGTLAMSRTEEKNNLLANFIREADLNHVFIRLQAGVTEVGYMYLNGNPLLNTTAWAIQGADSGKGDCVQLGRTGALSQVDCGATQYYICEFVKNNDTTKNSIV